MLQKLASLATGGEQAPGVADVASSQEQSAAKPFHFDVVSIRPSKPGSPDSSTQMRLTGDGLVSSNVSLNDMLTGVYPQLQFVRGRILGLPDWAKTEKFDIQAKVADSEIAEWSQITQHWSEAATARRNQSLLQLYTEQFKLKTHTETRDEQLYALVIAKGGSKLKPTTSANPPTMQMMGPGKLKLIGDPIGSVVQMCAQHLGRKVVDETGLTGRYDYTLDWTEYESPPATAPGSEPDNPQPPVFTVVQEQLGLKLVAQKGPVEYIVVDHAEKPEAMRLRIAICDRISS